jgi:steroid delta-isomerase-like uncharacterized protein
METEATKVLREYLEGAFARKDPAALDATVAPDAIDHAGVPGQPEGIEGFRLFISFVLAAFPDLDLVVEDCFGVDDRAVARWTGAATHEGDFLGIPPTHRRVTMRGMDIVRVRDGRITELWAETDVAGVMQQLTDPVG